MVSIDKLLPHFDKEDEETFYIKKGLICILEGFVEDYITMIDLSTDDEGQKVWRLYSMSSDNSYIVDEGLTCDCNVYSLKKVS